jgi:hypothetical protein
MIGRQLSPTAAMSGSRRIHVFPHLGVPTAVVGMARDAMVSLKRARCQGRGFAA